MLRIFNQYVSAKSVLLMMLESGLVLLALLCAVRLRFWKHPDEIASYIVFPDFAIQCGVVAIICLACFYYNDLYDETKGFGAVERVLRIEQAVGGASLVLGLLYFLLPGLLLGRGVFVIAMLLVAVFVFLGRKLIDGFWHVAGPLQHVAILGNGPLASSLAAQFAARTDLGIHLDGFIFPSSATPDSDDIRGVPVLGSAQNIEKIARNRSISRIIVALEDRRGALPIRELVTLRVSGIAVEDAATAFSELTGRISLSAVRPSWFVFSDGFHRSRWSDLLKRVFDIVFATIGLLLALPVMALVALAVRLDSPGPVFYRQTRVGRAGKSFELMKFRSMRADAERHNGAQWAVTDDPRVTRTGRYLRKYRLDELPQFWNVIRGDMSFVGPRPERPCFVEELRQIIPYYDERHSVRPGITGWAQVQYNYGASVEDACSKLEYDLFYLKNMSLVFDLAIVFQTVRVVLGGRGAR